MSPRADQPAKPSLKAKRTFYLDHDAVVDLSELQVDELRRTGTKPDLSELVSRAIRDLKRRTAKRASPG